MKKLLSIGLIVLATSLSACAPNFSPNTYDVSEVGVPSRVHAGVVISKRPVNIDANSGAGGLAGVTAGAAAGTVFGGSPAAMIVGAVGGAIAGGLVGNAVDQAVNHHVGFEYIIRLRRGPTISVVQASDLQFYPGQPVLVIYGPTTRIIPDRG